MDLNTDESALEPSLDPLSAACLVNGISDPSAAAATTSEDRLNNIGGQMDDWDQDV